MQKNKFLEKSLRFYHELKIKAIPYRNVISFSKGALSFILLALIFKNISISNLKLSFSSLSVLDYAFLLLLTFIVSLIYNYRYYLILKSKNYSISFFRLYTVNRFSNLINFILPGGLGQEVGRLFYLKNKKAVLITTLIDRVVGLISAVLIIIFSYIVNSHSQNVFYGMMIVLFICLIILGALKLLNIKINTKVYLAFLASILYSVGLAILAHQTFAVLKVYLPFWEITLYTTLISVLLMLPITINGYGLREYLWIILLKIPSNSIVSYTVIGYSIGLILSLPGIALIIENSIINRKLSHKVNLILKYFF